MFLTYSIFAVRVTAVSEGGNRQEQGGRLDVSGLLWVHSILSGWLTESMLGKHSTLLGGEVFGINRRYYHWEATGGRHVAQAAPRQLGEPQRWAVGLPATCSHLLVPRERASSSVRAHPQE